ncbi:MAG TPA: PEP-CTERM sorting domain-containing protein [Nostocaceae cyanobacterium]|nr:PEP-CTERM sorting domain-containing protein [Nostocaceae cyanobacterium]
MKKLSQVIAATLGLAVLATTTSTPAQAAVINFDSLPSETTVTNQYPEVTFSSEPGFEVAAFPVAAFYGSSSPNVIAVRNLNGSLDANRNLFVDFSQAVNNLSFLVVGNNTNGSSALIDIFTTTGFAGQVNLVTDGNVLSPDLINLASFTNITRISINSITDVGGIGYDDFKFEVSSATSVPEPATLFGLFTIAAFAVSSLKGRNVAIK